MTRLPLIVGFLACFAIGAAAEQPVTVLSQAVPLNPRDTAAQRVSELTYRGGIALRSIDPRFGGFSALHVSADGNRLLAVSDRGAWLSLGLRYDASGRLVGVGDARMGTLIDQSGKVLMYRDTDVEALTVLPDGSMLVAFERNHRILHYPPSSPPFSKRPTKIAVPPDIAKAPANLGIEALAPLGGGHFVALSEYLVTDAGALAAWIGRAGVWEPFAYETKPGFRVSDAATFPNGDVMVLEHHYNFVLGNVVRLVRVPRGSIAPRRRVSGHEIATLQSPLTTENFEGVSIRQGNGREALVYLISDDNFNPSQRTLLMMFSLFDESPAPPQ